MLLSERARRPRGKIKTTLPAGNPNTRSISVCALQTDASLRMEKTRFAAYSLVFLIRALGFLCLLVNSCADFAPVAAGLQLILRVGPAAFALGAAVHPGGTKPARRSNASHSPASDAGRTARRNHLQPNALLHRCCPPLTGSSLLAFDVFLF